MLLESLFDLARHDPGRTAVVHNAVAYDYGWFAGRIESYRIALAEQGPPPDGVAVLCLRNFLDTWVIGLAARSLGFTTLSIRDEEEMRAIRLRDVRCALTSDPHRWPGVPAICDERGWPLLVLPRAGGPDGRPAPLPPAGSPLPTGGGNILITSGTTGDFKMLLRDAATEEPATVLHAGMNEIDRDSTVYVANIGPWTAGGYRWPLLAWSSGGTAVIHQARDLYGPLTRGSFTHFFTTPDLLSQILRAGANTLRRNDEMRLMVTAGVLPRVLWEEARTKLTTRVYSVYASTEALTLAVTPIETAEDLKWHRIHPAREVQVVDENDREVEPGVMGYVRSRVIDGVTGYLDDESASRMFFRDGYFYSGDMGAFGPDGRLMLHGRDSDVVNLLGNKFATGDIERAIAQRLGVEEVCIVALESGSGPDDLHVVIQADGSIAADELTAVVQSELGPMIRAPVRAHVVERLPRNEMGKVMRPALRQVLRQALREQRPR